MKLQLLRIGVDIRVKARLDRPKINIEMVVKLRLITRDPLCIYVTCSGPAPYSLGIKRRDVIDINAVSHVRADLQIPIIECSGEVFVLVRIVLLCGDLHSVVVRAEHGFDVRVRLCFDVPFEELNARMLVDWVI